MKNGESSVLTQGEVMKNQKKPSVTSLSDSEEAQLEQEFQPLIEALLQSTPHSDEVVDPFEEYTQKLKNRVHQDAQQLSNRFAKGYRALLNDLEK